MYYLLIFCLSLSLHAHAETYDPSNKINQLALTMALLKQNYIDQMSDNTIAEKAIRGLLNELDPHSDYLDVEELISLEESASGQVTGIGVEVTVDNGLIKVVTPLDGSPADRSGLKTGDMITHVDDHLVIDIGFSGAVSKIKGEAGTTVQLTVVRPGAEKPLHFTIVREEIKAPSVKSAMITDDVGYVRISHFGLRTPDETKQAVKTLIREHPNMAGIVIDLRNNPGGILDSAIEITDIFLDRRNLNYDGNIAISKERDNKVMQTYKSRTRDLTRGLPVVVLINAGSASGSEIMAGALKDHKRAILIGENTFGKGSIQTVMPLSDTTAIKITTGLYYTPAGHVVQKKGIQPNIISPALIQEQKNEFTNMRESDYSNSLTAKKINTQEHQSDSSVTEMQIVQDYGFPAYQAVQTLRNQKRQCA